MSGYQGPKNKIAKRYRVNLWGRPNDPMARLKSVSFQKKMRKRSEYSLRLNEKQKLKYFYGGIREKIFKNYYVKARKVGGNIGSNFLKLLERRLDTVIYRMNFVPTIFASRQIVSHGHVLVNGKRVNIPSYLVKENDEISLREKSKEIPLICSHVEHPERDLPNYFSFDANQLQGKVERLPEREEIYYPFILNESLIVEFYSR